jgi:hypothetical protein
VSYPSPHPLATIFPPLNEQELAGLADDIAVNGLREPVTIYEGLILDGRNRAIACEMADVKMETVPYKGSSPLAFVISKNLKRRHLSTSQRQIIAAELSGEHGQAGDNQWSANLQTTPTRAEAAGMLNVSERGVVDAAKLIDVDRKKAEAIKAGKLDETVSGALKQSKRKTRETNLRKTRDKRTADARKSERRKEIVVADIRKKWRPKGVDVIITDPPYVAPNAIELYSALADFAVAVLPAGGALVTMCWQPILDQVMIAMARPQLTFRWLIAWMFDSGADNARTFDMARRVHDGWKPVLVYHKGGWADDAPAIYDVIKSPGRVVVEGGSEGDLHVWEQGVEGVEKLVRYACMPGAVVCDPFVGSGTTGVAALNADCDFIGADIKPGVVASAKARLGIE